MVVDYISKFMYLELACKVFGEYGGVEITLRLLSWLLDANNESLLYPCIELVRTMLQYGSKLNAASNI